MTIKYILHIQDPLNSIALYEVNPDGTRSDSLVGIFNLNAPDLADRLEKAIAQYESENVKKKELTTCRHMLYTQHKGDK